MSEDDTIPPTEPFLDDQTAEALEAVAETRRRLAEVPASVVVTNHAMGLFELAAIHLSAEPPAWTMPNWRLTLWDTSWTTWENAWANMPRLWQPHWAISAWSLSRRRIVLQRADLEGFFADDVKLGGELHGSAHFHVPGAVSQNSRVEWPDSALPIGDLPKTNPAVELGDSPLANLRIGHRPSE